MCQGARAVKRPLPPSPLDRTKQCCGVCLPTLPQEGSASMTHHRARKASAVERLSRPVSKDCQRGSGNCANCPNPPRLRSPAPYSGTKEFPVATARAHAISCRVAAVAGRFIDLRWAKPGAGIAGIARIGVSPEGCALRFVVRDSHSSLGCLQCWPYPPGSGRTEECRE